jgi:hypothetical protein
MTGPYANEDLNRLVAMINSYSSLVPKDDVEARSISLMVGKLQMQLQALKGSKP